MHEATIVNEESFTFSLNSKSKNFVKVGNRSVFDADMVKEQMGLASEKFAQYKEMAEFLSTRRYNAESLIQYYNEVFPHREQRTVSAFDDLLRTAQLAASNIETQPGAEFCQGTWWQAFNSVTYMTDHIQGRSAESRLNNQWFGYNQGRKINAANKAVEFATAA